MLEWLSVRCHIVLLAEHLPIAREVSEEKICFSLGSSKLLAVIWWYLNRAGRKGCESFEEQRENRVREAETSFFLIQAIERCSAKWMVRSIGEHSIWLFEQLFEHCTTVPTRRTFKQWANLSLIKQAVCFPGVRIILSNPRIFGVLVYEGEREARVATLGWLRGKRCNV